MLTTLMFLIHSQLTDSQCGPDRSRPYPPGVSSCPTRDMGDGMEPHSANPSPPSGSSSSSACTTPPCAASALGDVGLTTVAGTDTRTGLTLAAGENLYGPFEAGFSSAQDSILGDLGCNPGSLGHVVGGIDTYTAEQMVAFQCSVTLPRVADRT